MASTSNKFTDHDDDSLFSPDTRDEGRLILRPSPDLQVLGRLAFSRSDWSDQIERDIKLEMEALNSPQNRRPRMTREREFERIRIQVEAKYRQMHHEQRSNSILWMQSERTLNLLRTKGMTSVDNREVSQNAMARFVLSLNLECFPEIVEGIPVLRPNQYLELTQPTLVANFGFPFYSTVLEQPSLTDDVEGSNVATSFVETITGINIEFWAAFLSGDKRLGHDLVFYVPESQFYFFDIVAGCYLPTSEAKVCHVASQAIKQRAWGQEPELATMLLTAFRTKKVLDEIIYSAKAILSADRGFFEGEQGQPRWNNNSKAPDMDSLILEFVEQQIEPASGGILSLGECLDRFEACGACRLSRKDTTQKVNIAIRDAHGVGLRNDLKCDNLQVKGWTGLRLRMHDKQFDPADVEVRDVGQSVRSGSEVRTETPTTLSSDTAHLN